MSCFKHEEKNAVGACKSCGRALCKECVAADMESIACKGRCEAKVRALDAYMEKTIFSRCNTNSSAGFIVSALLLILSVMLYRTPDLEVYGILMGVLTLALFCNTLRSFK